MQSAHIINSSCIGRRFIHITDEIWLIYPAAECDSAHILLSESEIVTETNSFQMKYLTNNVAIIVHKLAVAYGFWSQVNSGCSYRLP